MIEFFIPGIMPEKILLREELLREYQFFKTGTGRFQSLFEEEKIDSESDEDDFPQHPDTRRTLDIDIVSKWIVDTGGHMSRLACVKAWFA